MTKEQILQAFEGRWRIKGNFGQLNSNAATMSFDEFYEYIKDLCRNFFTAGIMLADKDCVVNPPESIVIVDTDKIPEFVSEDKQFDYWWNMYDKKRGREKCLKKWLNLTSAERYACAAATPMYVASTPDKQYRKDPLTYLNGKCWNDEIINRNGTNQPTKQQQDLNKLASILTD